jgi:plasmid replication initiation protein
LQTTINGLFDKALKPYLLELKERFMISDIKYILPMKSTYSKRIYLLLKEYFKIKVLKQAETDINKFTDLEVNFTEKKLGRKVVEITYTIRKNTTDLKTFIKVIREDYINQILHYTKDNRPIKCSAKGFLYYGDEDKSFIPDFNKKKS